MQSVLNFITWAPDPIALDFGFIRISWYGLTWSLSIIVSYFLAKVILKKEGRPIHFAALLIQYHFIGALIGARIFDVFYYHLDEFLKRPILLLEIWNGGMSSHGAMMGVAIAILIFIRKYPNFTFIWILDKIAIISSLASVFIRIGNFINSELYGKITTVPWAVVFPLSDPRALPRHPVQLYEAIWYLFCFSLFWYLNAHRKLRPGFLTALFGIVFLGGRFFIEFLKEPDVLFGPFSNTQWLSVVAVLIGLAMLFQLFRTHKSIQS